MKRSVKFLLLFLALLLPVLIYVFLKTFGKNEFKVPVLYQEEQIVSQPDCGSFKYTVPYVVPPDVLRSLAWSQGTLNIFVVRQSDSGLKFTLPDEFEGLGFVVRQVPPEMRSIANCALLL